MHSSASFYGSLLICSAADGQTAQVLIKSGARGPPGAPLVALLLIRLGDYPLGFITDLSTEGKADPPSSPPWLTLRCFMSGCSFPPCKHDSYSWSVPSHTFQRMCACHHV